MRPRSYPRRQSGLRLVRETKSAFAHVSRQGAIARTCGKVELHRGVHLVGGRRAWATATERRRRRRCWCAEISTRRPASVLYLSAMKADARGPASIGSACGCHAGPESSHALAKFRSIGASLRYSVKSALHYSLPVQQTSMAGVPQRVCPQPSLTPILRAPSHARAVPAASAVRSSILSESPAIHHGLRVNCRKL
jgi:hypothetical protein